MRMLSSHLTAMDRQVQESLNICHETRKQGQYLNLKLEWARSKIPGLQVSLPKGVARDKAREKEGSTQSEASEETWEQELKEGPVG